MTSSAAELALTNGASRENAFGGRVVVVRGDVGLFRGERTRSASPFVDARNDAGDTGTERANSSGGDARTGNGRRSSATCRAS
jgi:hypothetical protein